MGQSNQKRSGARKSAATASFAAIGLLSALLVLFAWWLRPSFLSAIDLKATDAMFMVRGGKTPPPEIVIVAIDERSVNGLGRWPWTRETTASLISALSQAKTVALDIVFSEPQDLRSDFVLSEAITGSRNVVLGYFFRGDTDTAPDPAHLERLNSSRIALVSMEGGALPAPWPVFRSIETNTHLIGNGATGFGAFNTIPGSDGLYREVNLLLGYGTDVYPSLPVEALRHYTNGRHSVHLAAYGVDGLSIGDRLVPVDETGALTLNYYGQAGSFRTYSAVDVISGLVKPEEFKGKLVFVGVTEKAVYDIRPTPMDALMSGVELHATAAGNILNDDFILRDGRVILFDVAVTALAPVVLALLLAGVRRTVSGLSIFVLLTVAAVAGEFVLFSFWNIKPAVIYPALSLMVCYMSGEAYRNLVVEKRNRYLKRAFSSYVSPELVSEILDDPSVLKLGGEKRNVSVLFSDIRGFTGISERLSPEDLVEFLNRYLSPMTGIVLDEKGMVDKYIGDAIMAVFNAPVEVPDHCQRACRAALRMIDVLASLNSGWKDTGSPLIEIGIGINTGEAVVGNMGADLKLNYTAIGDAVNLAARLESLNKVYGTNIIVSKAVREASGGKFLFRELDMVKVRGREDSIIIYELVGRVGADPDKERFVSRFHEALALYRGRRFDEAQKMFTELSWSGDAPSTVYAERCGEYLRSGAPEGWNGVFDAALK